MGLWLHAESSPHANGDSRICQAGVADVIGFMEEYSLTREDRDAILDIAQMKVQPPFRIRLVCL